MTRYTSVHPAVALGRWAEAKDSDLQRLDLTKKRQFKGKHSLEIVIAGVKVSRKVCTDSIEVCTGGLFAGRRK